MDTHWSLATRLPSGRLSFLLDNCDRPVQLNSEQEAYQAAIMRYVGGTFKDDIVIVRVEAVSTIDYEGVGKPLAEEYKASQAKKEPPRPVTAKKPVPAHVGYVHVPWGQFPVTRKQADALIAQRMIYQTGTNAGGIIYHPHNTRTFVEVKEAMEALGIGVQEVK